MPADTKVISIPYHRMDEATDVLARAFATDPVISVFVPQERENRYAVLRELFRYSALARLVRMQPVVGLEWDNKIVGIGLLMTPYNPAGTGLLERQWQKTSQALGDDSVKVIEEFVAQRERFMPPRLHHTLTVLGVDPTYQGMGFGVTTLDAVLELAKDDVVSCGVMLETAGFKNKVFYERSGFKSVGQTQFHGVDVDYMYYSIR